MNLLKGKKSGITLIEALIVIALGIGLIAAGLTLFSSGQNTNKVKDESSNIGQIYTATSSIYMSDVVASTIQADAVKAGVFGKTLRIIGTTTVKNSWDGDVTLARLDDTSFSLTYTNIPEDKPCVDLINSTRKSGFKRIAILGGQTPITTPVLVSALTPASIIGACANATTGDVVSVTWYSSNS